MLSRSFRSSIIRLHRLTLRSFSSDSSFPKISASTPSLSQDAKKTLKNDPGENTSQRPPRSLEAQTRWDVMRLNKKLLQAISEGDWETYSALADPYVTAFEPEAAGHLVSGHAFHQHYFPSTPRKEKGVLDTMASPYVRLCSPDVALVCYVRLRQGLDKTTNVFEETRVWQRTSGVWKNIHLHRSVPTSPANAKS